MSFAGKTVLITGASSGIGRALAVELARQGARVGVTARRTELLAELVSEVRNLGGTIEAQAADVSHREELQSALNQLVGQLGPVDILFANAGVGFPSGANPQNVLGVEEMIRVNYLGAIYAMEAVLPAMLQRGSGHLVAISSLAAYKGFPGSLGYCASKSAISAYCEGLRIELRPTGVKVTTVCPGFIRTPMTDKNTNPMPFIMDADAGAKRILRAVARGTKVYNFPWIMYRMIKMTRWLPDWLVARLAMRPAFKD
jgi:short-subunit dehydrogenase